MAPEYGATMAFPVDEKTLRTSKARRTKEEIRFEGISSTDLFGIPGRDIATASTVLDLSSYAVAAGPSVADVSRSAVSRRRLRRCFQPTPKTFQSAGGQTGEAFATSSNSISDGDCDAQSVCTTRQPVC